MGPRDAYNGKQYSTKFRISSICSDDLIIWNDVRLSPFFISHVMFDPDDSSYFGIAFIILRRNELDSMTPMFIFDRRLCLYCIWADAGHSESSSFKIDDNSWCVCVFRLFASLIMGGSECIIPEMLSAPMSMRQNTVRRQTITWTNAGLLSIGPLGTSISVIWVGILFFLISFHSRKCI